MQKAVLQFMMGTVLNNEQQAKDTLHAIAAAGYTGIHAVKVVSLNRLLRIP